MRTIAWLLCTLGSISTVHANVEKTIFLGPSAIVLPNVRPGIDELDVDTLEPAELPILATQLSVKFPTESAPRGLDSWYLLRGLEEGRRYEVRICWPAFQPTDFWLDTFTITQVDTPELIASLAGYTDRARTSPSQKLRYTADGSSTAQSLLFLRVQAAASYYSTNKTLMQYPPLVDVDIILEPFILNVLPRSLGPAAIYITVVAVAAWFISGYTYRWIIAVSKEYEEKDHKE
ncbi:hypothetical protein P171DRAFT_415614 [Karstenula rhodostoma CBS 690.94]|uniref:Protein PBN1 n=1 Tax=Karstenula rhodostoma CBS 690.94 TaxID=1392251 RepID=A0A9P4UB83_9PLEO|nr:hypothetical protein P171DRAFT_415614 [Karstenula rhodostoma CBS 690.94]